MAAFETLGFQILCTHKNCTKITVLKLGRLGESEKVLADEYHHGNKTKWLPWWLLGNPTGPEVLRGTPFTMAENGGGLVKVELGPSYPNPDLCLLPESCFHDNHQFLPTMTQRSLFIPERNIFCLRY